MVKIFAPDGWTLDVSGAAWTRLAAADALTATAEAFRKSRRDSSDMLLAPYQEFHLPSSLA
jgi:hypothetical protein